MLSKHILTLTVGGVSGAILVAGGCATVEEMAPPVSVALVEYADPEDPSMEALVHGRQIFIGKCADCHTVLPVADYSIDRWRQILPRMGRMTRLTPEEQRDLEAYVYTAHAYLEAAPKSGQ